MNDRAYIYIRLTSDNVSDLAAVTASQAATYRPCDRYRHVDRIKIVYLFPQFTFHACYPVMCRLRCGNGERRSAVLIRHFLSTYFCRILIAYLCHTCFTLSTLFYFIFYSFFIILIFLIFIYLFILSFSYLPWFSLFLSEHPPGNVQKRCISVKFDSST